MTNSHSRRPLPNWVIRDIDDSIMDLSEVERHLDRILGQLERGDGLRAGIALARIMQAVVVTRHRLQVMRETRTPHDVLRVVYDEKQ